MLKTNGTNYGTISKYDEGAESEYIKNCREFFAHNFVTDVLDSMIIDEQKWLVIFLDETPLLTSRSKSEKHWTFSNELCTKEKLINIKQI